MAHLCDICGKETLNPQTIPYCDDELGQGDVHACDQCRSTMEICTDCGNYVHASEMVMAFGDEGNRCCRCHEDYTDKNGKVWR